MKINRFRDEHQAWDEYVQRSKMATFFHQIGWKKVVEKTFGHQPCYLFAKEDGQIQGILPMFLIKNILFGKQLVSVPYAIYGGVCADNENSEGLLIEEAKKIAHQEKASYVELRNVIKSDIPLPINDLYVNFSKKLPADPADCLQCLSSEGRRCFRKAESYGLKAIINHHELKTFYHLFKIRTRNIGTPVYPYSLFENILNEFHDKIQIIHIKFREKIIASAINFLFKNTIIGYYASSLPQYWGYKPNHMIYLKGMEYGSKNGYESVDFGRSRKGSGSYHFKKHIGLKPQPLYYQYYLVKGKKIPQINPSNPKFDIPKKIWQRLPLPITNWLGPKITKNIP